jgi:hypothetical protein
MAMTVVDLIKILDELPSDIQICIDSDASFVESQAYLAIDTMPYPVRIVGTENL